MKKNKDYMAFNVFNIKSPASVLIYLLVLALIVVFIFFLRLSLCSLIFILVVNILFSCLISPYRLLIHRDGSIESRSVFLRLSFFSGANLVQVSADEKKNMIRLEDSRGVVYLNVHNREEFLSELAKILPEVVKL